MLGRSRSCLGVVLASVLLAVLPACQSVKPQTDPSTVAAVAEKKTELQQVADKPVTHGIVRGYSEFVMDLSSGRELASYQADELRYPASLTKMMTLYLLFEDIAAGRTSLSSDFTVSANAARQPPSKIGLREGETITAREAAEALAVKSANDVAIVIAENLAGSEAEFARRMTAKARSLGLKRTLYYNASGLPDTRQVTTARDMAVLGRSLKLRFPQYASMFRAKSFKFRGRSFKTTNNLLGKVFGVDGLKTGYTRASGYNLVSTARRGGKRRLVVVMGGQSEAARDKQVTQLLDASF
ncbi:MAG: D-alanyl-D-alanine carboxypeptidase [Rhodobacteraceae bacterium]|nr:D-alanyl-D-alanine carboxypeptidase [Paracoccaceae bacterium]